MSQVKLLCNESESYAISVEKWKDDNSNNFICMMLHMANKSFNVRTVNLHTFSAQVLFFSLYYCLNA